MARRSKYSSSRARRPIRRTRRAKRRPRYAGRTRTRTYSRAMSNKKILNLTSRKKRNTMMQYANTSSSGGGTVPIGPGAMFVSGNNQYIGVWTPTGMDLNSAGSIENSITEQSLRTATTCFIKGLTENMRIETSSGVPWYWRRIIFTSKQNVWLQFSVNDATKNQSNDGNPGVLESSTNGWERLYFNQYINNAPATISDWQSIVFRGTQNRDWSDPLTAQIDTSQVDLRSDRLMTIRSGNASGTVKHIKRYYSVNKNLTYADDESGNAQVTNHFSVRDKRGMGDMHILDIFLPGTGATSTDILKLTSTSTLYWHEK
ncbi:capsid protein [Blackfly genomovirus 6]|nr:capsid protein [Blackfly genomovirus 6]